MKCVLPFKPKITNTMKITPLFTTVFLSGMFLTTNAQVIPKGTTSVSGNISYNESHSTNDFVLTSTDQGSYSGKARSGNLGVTMGYFLKDNLSLNYGLFSTMNQNKNEYSNGLGGIDKQTNTTISYLISLGGGMSKFYFIKQTQFAVELEGSLRAGMGRRNQENTFNNTTNSRQTMNVYRGDVYLIPRLHYFINRAWSVNASIGYINYSYSAEHSVGNDNFTSQSNYLNANFALSSFSLGLRYYF
jgi:hypothetical protein